MTTAIVWVVATALTAQAPPLPIADGQVIRLWSAAAPEARGSDDSDIPTLTVYLPRSMTAPTPAMIVGSNGSSPLIDPNIVR